MSLRHRARTGTVALCVAASAVIIGAGSAGASTASPAACGNKLLGSVVQIKLGSTHVGDYYVAEDTCNGDVFSELHFSTTLSKVSGTIQITNGYENHGGTNKNSFASVSSSFFWDSPLEPNGLDSSHTRSWSGFVDFNFAIGSTAHSCSAFTPTWNFSTGKQTAGGGMECDQS